MGFTCVSHTYFCKGCTRKRPVLIFCTIGSRGSCTRFVGKPEGSQQCILSYYDYFFGGRGNTNLGGERHQRGLTPPPPPPDKSSTARQLLVFLITKAVHYITDVPRNNYYTSTIAPPYTSGGKYYVLSSKHLLILVESCTVD